MSTSSWICPRCQRSFPMPAGMRTPAICAECARSGPSGWREQFRRSVPWSNVASECLALVGISFATLGLLVLALIGAALCYLLSREFGTTASFVMFGILFIGVPQIVLLVQLKRIGLAILNEIDRAARRPR